MTISRFTVPSPAADEAGRLAALRSLHVLDTAADPEIDRIAAAAKARFSAHLVAVSLVDEDRLWFKARLGIDAPQMARAASFCAHTILEAKTLVIADTQADGRFAGHPSVIVEDGIRFYAGALLVIDGHNIGTLCITDMKPRPDFGAEEAKALQSMADSVARRLKALREAGGRLPG